MLNTIYWMKSKEVSITLLLQSTYLLKNYRQHIYLTVYKKLRQNWMIYTIIRTYYFKYFLNDLPNVIFNLFFFLKKCSTFCKI